MNKKKENIIKQIFRNSSKGKLLLFLSVLSYTFGMFCSVLPYVSVYFIGKHFLSNGINSDKSMVFWVVVSAISIICNMMFTFLGSIGCHVVAFQTLFDYRINTMEHLGKLSMGYFSTHSSGGIQKVMDENIEKIESFIAHMLPDMVGSLAVLLSLFVGIAYLNPILALTVVISVIIGFLFQVLIFGGSRSNQIWADLTRTSMNITAAFSEYVRGMAEVKLFGKAGSITKTLENHIKECLGWEIKSYKCASFAMSMYKSIILSLLTFVLPVGIFLIKKEPDSKTILSLLMALIIVQAIYDPLMALVEYATQMGMLSAGVEQINAILSEPEIVWDNSSNKQAEGWDVEFENVSFSYQSGDNSLNNMALNNISIDHARQWSISNSKDIRK